MGENRLKLNPRKTETLFLCSRVALSLKEQGGLEVFQDSWFLLIQKGKPYGQEAFWPASDGIPGMALPEMGESCYNGLPPI